MQEKKLKARSLYWQNWTITQIASELSIPRTTIESWKKRNRWDDFSPKDRVEKTLETTLIGLITKEKKTPHEFKEIDVLSRQFERLARIRRYEAIDGNEADLNPNIERRNTKKRKPKVKNAFSEEQFLLLKEKFLNANFAYQNRWYNAGLEYRIRNILKSRQIGATFYFAREALIDAMETGRNQLFLSASKNQSHVFKQYIIKFAQEADIDLKGDPIVLPNGAELLFLGTNSKTAQSYHGNLYFDEYFWTNNFKELRKVASGMAMHKKWRQTYFSTPSTTTHDGYHFWTGEDKNKDLELDLSHENLKGGLYLPDGHYRNIITIEDAILQGCDLFDLETLKLEYTEEEFLNLCMCVFMDDSESSFPMSEIQKCFVDTWEVWPDYKPFAARPMGDKRVWIGYDPGYTGDHCAAVVLAPPAVTGGKFRLIEFKQFRGANFEQQAEYIKKLTEIYKVESISIDTTGLGVGVYELVAQFFPLVKPLNYNPELKNRLVLKAQSLMREGRLEFDPKHREIASAFLNVKKSVTNSGQITYHSRRIKNSHADLAWATMNALINEGFYTQNISQHTRNIVEIY